MKNTIIFTVVLFLAVIAASVYYFRDINKDHHDAIKPLKYLPENTMLITSIKNDEVTDNIFKDFELFDAILGFKELEKIRVFKNDILRDESLLPYFENSEVYISFHPEKDVIEPIFSIPTTENIEESDLPEILNNLSKKFKVGSTDTLGQKLTTFQIGNTDTTVYSIYYNNVIFASYSKDLIANIIDKNAIHLNEKQVDFFIKNNSRNTPFSIYFPHQAYENIIKHFQKRTQGKFLNQFLGLTGQSAWNINFKQDALMMTGESEVSNTSKNYIALFRNQSKTSQNLYNIFPSATSVYMEYSLSNKARFQSELIELFKNRDETSKINTALEMLQDSTSSVSKLSNILGDNFALIEQVNQTNLGFISIQDSTAWLNIKDRIAEDLGDSIFRFNNANLLYALYGDAFKDMSRPYFATINNTLVVANSSSLLRQYIADYNKKDLLIGTLGYKNFEKLQGNEANVTLFVHNKNANSKIINSLPEHYQNNYKNKEEFGYQDFYAWSIQLSGHNGNFSSQLYAVYKSKNALGSTPEWTYELENKAITRPYVFDHSDTSKFILLQELDHTIHAIHPSGKKLWSAVFEGRVVGDIQQLEDRTLLLVTDRSKLYLFDTNGNTLKGFSSSIPNEPISTPLVYTINGQKSILIPTSSKVYAFDMHGNQIKNWGNIDFDGRISTGLTQLANNEIAFGTTEGYIITINDKGEKTESYKVSGSVNITSISQNPSYRILAIDANSNINAFKDLNTSSKWNFHSNNEKFFSQFGQITSSSSPELISIHDNHLSVYEISDSLKVNFEYNFTKNIEHAPQFFKYPTSNQNWIGVASKATNLLYLFDENGSVVEGFPVEGQPLFYYGKINYNSNTYLLCMRRDHKLYAFKDQK